MCRGSLELKIPFEMFMRYLAPCLKSHLQLFAQFHGPRLQQTPRGITGFAATHCRSKILFAIATAKCSQFISTQHRRLGTPPPTSRFDMKCKTQCDLKCVNDVFVRRTRESKVRGKGGTDVGLNKRFINTLRWGHHPCDILICDLVTFVI